MSTPRILLCFASFAAAALPLTIAGCDASRVDATSAAGSSFQLDAAPAQPQPIKSVVDRHVESDPPAAQAGAAQADVSPEQAGDYHEVTLVGRIHAGDHDPFREGQASFLISELPDPSHGDGSAEHADNCPFCRRAAEKQVKALVEFTDASGQVLATDARKLLGVAKGDTVIIVGRARFEPTLNLVQIRGTGLYKQPAR